MPALALGSMIHLNNWDFSETRSMTGLDPPFTPDWTDPKSYLVNGLFSLFGINLTGDIYGPGINTWDNGVWPSDAGLTIETNASAVGTLSTDIDFWHYFQTQKVDHTVNCDISSVRNNQ
jgi:hypothetical protein